MRVVLTVPRPMADRIEELQRTRGGVHTFDEVALAALERGLAVLEGDWRDLIRLADAHDSRQEYGAARALYARALEATSEPGLVRTRIAETWRKGRSFPEAEAEYGRALEAIPNDPYALAGLGETLRMTGRLVEATALLERAIGLSPTHSFAIQGLAATFEQQGAHVRAIALYEQSLALGESDFARQGLERCRSALQGAVSPPASSDDER